MQYLIVCACLGGLVVLLVAALLVHGGKGLR